MTKTIEAFSKLNKVIDASERQELNKLTGELWQLADRIRDYARMQPIGCPLLPDANELIACVCKIPHLEGDGKMPEKQKAKRPERKYRVVATHIDRPSESDYAANLREVRELEHFFKRHGCDGLRVEKWTEGDWQPIEDDTEKPYMTVTVELEATQLELLLAKIAELADRVEALETRVKND